MKSKKYPKWFYLILPLIPILFIVMLELGLRLADYGEDLQQWIEITEDELILNPDIGAKYFTNTENYPHSNHDPFEKTKGNRTFRIFIFGGSSAAGFPYQPNGSFSRYIRDRLQIEYPENKIEVVNLAITAVNSITIRDLLPGVIEKNPDLIIIYAGHNEYYGALGVGSTESFIGNSFIIEAYLHLQEFRTTQLLKNTIKQIFKLSGDKANKSAGKTLMARMAEERAIAIGSDLYIKGKSQFYENIEHILSLLKTEGIPVIIGTLPSNILDQKPFFSFNDDSLYSADFYYKHGKQLFLRGAIHEADSVLKIAKDLDGLRFRAPSEFNNIIKELADEFKYPVIDLEEKLKKSSVNNIIGNDLMVDHLHPTLEGHFIIGKAFFEEIRKLDLQLQTSNKNNDSINHKIVMENFSFTKLDSQAAEYRILNLLNDWPFVKEKKDIYSGLRIKTKIDSIALKMVKSGYNWELAHQEAYRYYLSQNQMKEFIGEIKTLVSQYPYKLKYYNYGAEELIKRKQFDEAEDLLKRRYKIKPDLFSLKWIGNIQLFKKNYNEAVKFLTESLKYEKNDPQIYYNLGVAFLSLNEIEKSINSLQKSISIDPNYKQARNLLEELNKKGRL